jgi:glutamate racemase
VGVLATRGTVDSVRFQRLLQAHSAQTRFAVQACDGLARAIEQSTEEPLPAAGSAEKIGALCARYTGALGQFGLKTGDIDTLVLGCTHYVFAKDALRALVGPDVQILDTGAAVARQTRRILAQAGALAHERTGAPPGGIRLYTTGQLGALQAAAGRWLQLPAQCCAALTNI